MKTTLKDVVNRYKALVKEQKYKDAQNLINSIEKNNENIEDIINKCEIDLNLTTGNIKKAHEIINKTKILKLNNKSDAIIACKYYCSKYLFEKEDRGNFDKEISKIYKICGDDLVVNHELGNLYSWLGLSEESNNFFEKAISNKNEAARYDYGRHLLSIGKCEKGIELYSDRHNLYNFTNNYKIPDQLRIRYFEIKEWIKSEKNNEINLIAEQGLGDHIRLMYLAAAIGKKYGKNINFYCNDRISKYIKVDYLNILSMNNFEFKENSKYCYALDAIIFLEKNKNFILEQDIKIEYKRELVEVEEQKSIGVIFSTMVRNNFGDGIDLISPRIWEIEAELTKLNPKYVYSLQYDFDKIKINYNFKFEILHANQINYKDNWPIVLGLAEKLNAIVGPDSSQTLLAAMVGVHTVMLVPDKDPMYLGQTNRDLFIKNIKYKKFSDYRK